MSEESNQQQKIHQLKKTILKKDKPRVKSIVKVSKMMMPKKPVQEVEPEVIDSEPEVIDLDERELNSKFEPLNAVAQESDFLPKIKINELKKDENYIVTKIKKIKTRYGDKVVLELNNEWQFFVPRRVNDYIMNDHELFEYLTECTQKYKLFMRYVSATGGIKFLR